MSETPTFQYPFKTTKQIEKTQKKLIWLWLSVYLLIAGVFVAAFGFIAIPLFMLVACLLAGMLCLLVDEKFLLLDCCWLPQDLCGELVERCKSEPDLLEYRNQVITEGRRFTMGEYRAMLDWPDQKIQTTLRLEVAQAQAVACKALYDQAALSRGN